jgi:hypothetical protein
MQNAHLRIGQLEFLRNSGKTQSHVSVHVDRYMGEETQAHLISFFGNDAEVGAITAAIMENHRFELHFPDGSKQTVGLGKDASCYKGSLSVPGQKRPVRHVLAVSALLHANGSASRTFILNYREHTKEQAWSTLVALVGLPADPRWGPYILDELQREDKVKPLSGIGCEPVVIAATRDDLMKSIGRGCAARALLFPEKNGPVIWPGFTLRQALTAA